MTEANMFRMYKHFLATGQHGRAAEIANIPRYKHFPKEAAKVEVEEVVEEKTDKNKKSE